MALSHSDGTRVVITKGQYRNAIGTVKVKGKIKIVVLDDGTELMGVSDDISRVIK